MGPSRSRFVLAVLAATVLWGTTGTVARQAPSGASQIAVGLSTFGFGGLILFGLDARGHRGDRASRDVGADALRLRRVLVGGSSPDRPLPSVAAGDGRDLRVGRGGPDPRSAATTLALAEPVVATLLAVLVLGEHLAAQAWVGLAVIGIGLVLAAATERRTAGDAGVSPIV